MKLHDNKNAPSEMVYNIVTRALTICASFQDAGAHRKINQSKACVQLKLRCVRIKSFFLSVVPTTILHLGTCLLD